MKVSISEDRIMKKYGGISGG